MSKLKIFLIGGLWTLFLALVWFGLQEPREAVLGAPLANLTRGLAPITDDTYDIGSSTARYQNLFLSASSTVGLINSGSTASSTWQNGINLYTGCFSIRGTCLPSSTGITSLNGLTGASQTFTDDTNVTIVSGGTAHVITWAGTLSVARGGWGNDGTATTTRASGGLSVGGGGLASSAGLTITGGSINHTGGATSTFSNGITLTAGCIFKVATGACISEINPSLTGILEQAGGVIGAVTVGSGLNYTGTSLTLDLASNNTFTGLQNFGNSATSTQNGGMKFNNGINTAFISSSGRLELGTGSATSTLQYDPDNGGQLTMATSSDIVVLAQANKNPYGINIPNVSTASSSHPLFGKPYAHNIWGITCPTDKGTVVLHLNNSTGLQSNQITCTTASSTIFRITQNGKRSLVEPTTVIIESTTGNPGVVSIGLFSTTTPQ